ncbi:hypothetical protein [Maricaulis sp.]|uniref:hypothetical protein n=1 Tax=Maricaulis sp. TaxID=1486257 RepID=UPI003A8D11C0
MKLYKIHLVLGLVWLLIGMTLGQIMGESGDHGQLPTHAHIMLVGGVLSLAWGLLYRVLDLPARLIAGVQTLAHHLGSVCMVVALYMLFGGIGEPASVSVFIGLGGVGVMLSTLLILLLVILAKD